MNDAPRWPGADGSPGLDFSKKPQDGAKPVDGASKPESGAKPSESSKPAEGLNPSNPAGPAAGADTVKPQPPAPGPDDDVTREVKIPRSSAVSANKPEGRKSQNATDWELDSITRTPKSASSAPRPQPVLSSASEPLGDEAPAASRPSRAAAPEASSSVASRSGSSRRTRKARLRINRIDPWSVMKTSFLFSIAFGVMLVAGVGVLWSVVSGTDALNYVNDLINSVISDPQGGGDRFNIHEFLSWRRVMGLTAILAAIDVVIFTAVATLFAFLYNLASVVMGGLEITLAED